MRRSIFVAGATAFSLILLSASGVGIASAQKPAGTGQVFAARLLPLNAGSHTVGDATYSIPSASGNAVITVNGDDVSVAIDVNGVTSGTLHPQHIHAGTTCPDATADGNQDGIHDGFVDVIEGLPLYGPVLVPLDSNLNSFSPSLDFPVADANGSYSYNQSASKSHLQGELDQALKLGSRHVVIHGINPDSPLPASVKSLPGLPAWATLPVACGELHRTQ
ncbi:hypothetical protein [Pseudarthrobacter sp. N5]|uniref:hypothetical protein n=1 Tax=Pseudarthrobacter sp. N5 TaxID=3418416 RepID=UPI003CEBCC1E